MESKVHQINCFQRGKYGLYFWNQYRILLYSNLQKSPPWKLKSPPKFGKSQYRPVNAQNRRLGGRFCPRSISLMQTNQTLWLRLWCRLIVVSSSWLID